MPNNALRGPAHALARRDGANCREQRQTLPVPSPKPETIPEADFAFRAVCVS